MTREVTTCHWDSAELKQSEEGAASLQAGLRLLSSITISMEEEAHVLIAIPQHGANICMHQICQQPINQLAQLDIKQHTDLLISLGFNLHLVRTGYSKGGK